MMEDLLTESKTSADTLEQMELVGIEELQDFLGIGKDVAYELVHMPNFPSGKVGRMWRINLTQVQKDIRQAFDADGAGDLKDIWA